MPSLDTKITNVAVYPDRARVTRTGRITLEPGAQSVTMSGLTPRLDPSSLRASGKGQATLTGVQANLRHSPDTPPGAATAAQEKLQQLKDQDQIFADEQEAWQQRLTLVKNFGEQGSDNLARSVARGKLSLDGLTSVLDYLSQSQEAGATTLRDLGVRRRELAKQIDAAQQEADKLASAAVREAYAVTVNLDVTARDEVEIQLTYTVYDANWQARYDARLDGSQLEWTYLAEVRQQSGEDWNPPFALTLSTASLATGLDKPELPPWHVDVYRPREPRLVARRGAMPLAAAAPEAMALEANMPQAKMMYETAEVESSGPSVTYRIASPPTIPSDGEPHQTAIATMLLDVRLDYFCTPKVDEHAFIRARFTNASEYLILDGELNLYHGSDYVGTRRVEVIAPGQAVELFLGAEERLKVQRKEIERTVDKNLFGNLARTQLAYRITIENPSLQLARLAVLDQMPVTQHPDIKVKLREAAPIPTRQNEQGELAWDVELKKGDKAQIEFAVTIEYPKELRVVGV